MTDAPTRIGPYRIEREIGRGGMGVVYLGKDTHLDRAVAIKALPEHLAHDPERLARFEREAKTLASLNHPNVAGIHGVEEQGDKKYLVLEFVDGENLADRLDRGALDPGDALDIATQIAAGMEAAHDAGIIHRDLKPANIVITSEGQAKVLDFGLARMDDGTSSSSGELTSVPTITPDQANTPTMPGVILGTAAYMSPEQARGRKVDKRTDIWSFGVVLYEMLAGIGPFQGETVTDSIGAVLHKEPDLTRLPAATPRHVRRVLELCLIKDRKRRLRDIGDARLELEDQTRWLDQAGTGPDGRLAVGPLRLALLSLLLVAASAAGGIAVWRGMQTPAEPKTVRFQIFGTEPLGVDPDPSNQALSPDGTMLVYKEGGEGKLWVRALATLESRGLEGTEGANVPFWSPDSREIAYFDLGQRKLRHVSASGGPVVEVCDVPSARGGTWNQDDVILFADAEGPIFKVPASGGRPEAITKLQAGETGHRFPYFLPDGRRFLYTALPAKDGKFDLYLGELNSSERQFVVSARGGAVYHEGNLYYQRDGSLAMQPFDGQSLPLQGEPTILRESMSGTDYGGGPGFSMSRDGVLSYATFTLQPARLSWMDREGRQLEPVPIDPAPYSDFEISHDARRVALVRKTAPGKSEIWVGDLERGVVTRLSEESMVCETPRWSPDDTRIAYSIQDKGPQSFVVRELRNPSRGETLLESDLAYKRLEAWTPDGDMLVFNRQDAETLWDIWLYPLTGDSGPQLYLKTPFSETGGRISPDGHWMAYASNESGANEGYVQPFPEPGLRYQVTKGGGWAGVWLDGGQRLLYLEGAAIEVADVITGQDFRLGPGRTFYTSPPEELTARTTQDGKRFLALLPAGAPVRNSLTVVLNAIP